MSKAETLLLVPFGKLSPVDYQRVQLSLLGRFGNHMDEGIIQYEEDFDCPHRDKKLEIHVRYFYSYGEKYKPITCGMCRKKKYKTVNGFINHLKSFHKWEADL